MEHLGDTTYKETAMEYAFLIAMTENKGALNK